MQPLMSHSVAQGHLVTQAEWSGKLELCLNIWSAEIMRDFVQDGLMKGQLAPYNICEQAYFLSSLMLRCAGVCEESDRASHDH